MNSNKYCIKSPTVAEWDHYFPPVSLALYGIFLALCGVYTAVPPLFGFDMNLQNIATVWNFIFALAAGLLCIMFLFLAVRSATTSPADEGGIIDPPEEGGFVAKSFVPEGYEFSGESHGLRIFSKRPDGGKSHIPERVVEVYRGDERVGIARVLNVHSECSWVWSSTKDFEYFATEEPCDLKVTLRQSYFEDRLKLARNIVAVGLASYPVTGEGNTSHERAHSLAKLISEAIPELNFDRNFWALDLGRAQTETTEGDILEARQRSAVIIGVQEWYYDVELETLIRVTLEAVELDGIVLSDYEFSNSAIPNRVDITGRVDPSE